MDHSFLDGKLVIIKGSWCLPREQAPAIDALARSNVAVILLQFGDYKYNLPADYTFPPNVHLIAYDFESIKEQTQLLQDILRNYKVEFASRHLLPFDPYPFLICGSIFVVPESLAVCFVNSRESYLSSNLDKVICDVDDTTWDV